MLEWVDKLMYRGKESGGDIVVTSMTGDTSMILKAIKDEDLDEVAVGDESSFS